MSLTLLVLVTLFSFLDRNFARSFRWVTVCLVSISGLSIWAVQVLNKQSTFVTEKVTEKTIIDICRVCGDIRLVDLGFGPVEFHGTLNGFNTIRVGESVEITEPHPWLGLGDRFVEIEGE